MSINKLFSTYSVLQQEQAAQGLSVSTPPDALIFQEKIFSISLAGPRCRVSKMDSSGGPIPYMFVA